MEPQTQNRKTPELVASIMKNGGRLLLVGDGVTDLPKQIVEHPQIICWDYSKKLENKEVPANVKIIMYNRWISHALAKRLHNASVDLHAIKFPMLKNREIKELLSEMVQAEPIKDKTPEQIEQVVEEIVKQEPVLIEELEPITIEENMAKKNENKGGKESPVKDFVVKNIKVNIDYSVKGTKVVEARRLFDLAKKEGLKTTIGSVANTVGMVIREIGKNKSLTSEHGKAESLAMHVPRPRTPQVTPKGNVDDFVELERLISDAIVAMKLVQEHLPKVRKETEKLRGMREKVMKLFE